METEMMLQTYYRKAFPAELIFNTLEITEHRELSFCTAAGTYMRYLTFENAKAFRDKLEAVNPSKVDVGAIYDIRPAKHNGAVVTQRELVFDIDLTDYPRTCCQDKTVCVLCYKKIKCAVKLLDYILSAELGFKHYGFVFSGRRGVHCWVFENKEMTINVRNDVYKYLQMVVDKNLKIPEYEQIMAEYECVDSVQEYFLRIDKEVTTSMTHLIKMPFCVHPNSLKLSVPLDPRNITELNDIPTLEQVVEHPEVLQPFVEIMAEWYKKIQKSKK